jgi:hypothetical protein
MIDLNGDLKNKKYFLGHTGGILGLNVNDNNLLVIK